MQLEKSTNPVTNSQGGVGYAKLSLEILSCADCVGRGKCLIARLHRNIDHKYHLQENRNVIQRDHHIYRADNPAKSLYFIHKGSVKSYIVTEDGDEQVMNFHLAGDVVGLEALGSDKYITSTVALEKTTLCKLPLDYLGNLNVEKPILEVLTQSVIHEQNMKIILAKKDADGRMASFLLFIAQHNANHNQPENHFDLSMTRQDIANYLGMAIETVSRTLRKFRDRGVIQVKRRSIQIADLSVLYQIAGVRISR
jgi:CRP/FNR family transcriptional regulator